MFEPPPSISYGIYVRNQKRLLELRTSNPEAGYRVMAKMRTRALGIKRNPRSVQVRLTLLSSAPDKLKCPIAPSPMS